MIAQIQAIIHHPRFADGAAVVSGGTAAATSWFTAMSDIARFGANVVTIVTGSIAIAHYAPTVIRAVKRLHFKLRSKL